MDKKITFSDQNQTCKNVGILRVLFDQILHENMINVVKGDIYEPFCRSQLVLSCCFYRSERKNM